MAELDGRDHLRVTAAEKEKRQVTGEAYPGEQEGPGMGWEESKAWGSGEQAEHTHRENVPQPTQHRLTMKLCTT